MINPLTPSDAVRKPKNLLSRIILKRFWQNLKKYNPSGKRKFNNLGISQSLERNLIEKKTFEFLNLNSNPNTLGGYGLSRDDEQLFLFRRCESGRTEIFGRL